MAERAAGAAADAPRGSARAYLAAQLLGWAAYGTMGVAIAGGFAGMTLPLAVTTYAGAAFGALGTHLLRGVLRRRGWLALPLPRLVPRLLAGILVVAAAVELAVWGFGLWVTRVYTPATSTPAVLLATTFSWVVTLVLWLSLYCGVHFFRRWRLAEIRRLRSEVAAREAQLDALSAQVHPHFLFNALNTLRALIAEDPARARDLTTELSELMRYALQAGRRERVALAEELEVVEAYLRIEGARFEDRLRWTVDAPAGLRAARVPPMLLQTLVENAVKHGVGARPEGGEVAVSARRDGAALALRVTNPGRLADARAGAIGLANARERLRLLHDGRAALTLAEDGAGHVVAEIVLPFEEAP